MCETRHETSGFSPQSPIGFVLQTFYRQLSDVEFVMKLRAALAVTATILAGAVGMGGLSGCALPTGMAGLGNGAGTGLTGTQVA
ncbi:MAG: hypothetical protein D8B53_06010, partial [Corynebacterium sp.]